MLQAVQQILIEALLSDDPAAHLRAALPQATGLSAEERCWLEAIDSDGLHLSGLLVKKLRFERLTRADPALGELFAQQPAEFMQQFRAYVRAIPPSVYFPGQEAYRFRQWQATQQGEQ
ncbi:MAG: hypothetical protein JNM56_28885 [Planctomycetia bacterium]|nr:hypothetical protein [Planctomycetia bacterium]